MLEDHTKDFLDNTCHHSDLIGFALINFFCYGHLTRYAPRETLQKFLHFRCWVTLVGVTEEEVSPNIFKGGSRPQAPLAKEPGQSGRPACPRWGRLVLILYRPPLQSLTSTLVSWSQSGVPKSDGPKSTGPRHLFLVISAPRFGFVFVVCLGHTLLDGSSRCRYSHTRAFPERQKIICYIIII